MKYMVVYSSRTGNTKKVAEAIVSALPEGTPCVAAAEAPTDLSSYDCVFAGFWVDKGTADEEAKKVLETLTAKKVAVFATLGANPASEHAHKCLVSATELVPAQTEVVDSFICQGAVDPKLIEMMYKRFPADSPHGKNPESEARHAEAAKHPDEADLAAARAFAVRVTKKVSEA